MNLNYYLSRFNLSFPDYCNQRYKKLSLFEKFLDGTVYDQLTPFFTEYRNSGKQFIPLAQRRPSVIYNIYKIIIDEVSSLLFGENHFPSIKCSDNAHVQTAEFLQDVANQSNLRLKMMNAVRIGSVGSVAVIVKYIEGNYIFETLKTKNLKGTFSISNENVLTELVEKQYYTGEELVDNGYTIPDEKLNSTYCLIREWTDSAEIYYMPYLVRTDKEKDFKLTIDTKRSSVHDLGFVPAVWMRNPSIDDNGLDGRCIFEDVIDFGIEIDYQMSQHGRGLKYNSDPTLVIKDPGRLENEELVKGTGALMIGKDGDAKLLQLDASATTAVIDYVNKLRQLAMEVLRGDRSNPDKLLAGHSGKALKILNKPLVSLVSELRIAYGEIGLKAIYNMILAIDSKVPDSERKSINKVDGYDCTEHLILDWPPFYPETESDLMSIANTLNTLTDGGIMSKETATKEIAPIYKIQDVEAERQLIAKDKEELMAMQPQVQEKINA